MFSGSWSRRARSTASETRRGVSGVSLKLAPMLRKASPTALAMAAGGAIAPPSPRPLTPYSVASAGDTICASGPSGNFGRAGHHVVAEGGGERLAQRVGGDFLVKRGADALGDAALHLAVDDHRIDHDAAVLRDRVVEKLDRAGVGLDRNHDGMGAVGEHAAGFLRFVGRGGVEQRIHTGRQVLLTDIRRVSDLGEADAAARTMHEARLETRVGEIGLQEMRADPQDFFRQHPAGCATAPPANTMEREAKVPKPNGAVAVSP